LQYDNRMIDSENANDAIEDYVATVVSALTPQVGLSALPSYASTHGVISFEPFKTSGSGKRFERSAAIERLERFELTLFYVGLMRPARRIFPTALFGRLAANSMS